MLLLLLLLPPVADGAHLPLLLPPVVDGADCGRGKGHAFGGGGQVMAKR